MLIALALTVQAAAAAPIEPPALEARLVAVDQHDTNRLFRGAQTASYQRSLHVEYTNRSETPRALTLCPSDAKVDVYRQVNGDWRVEDRFAPFGWSPGEGWRSACGQVTLAPNETRAVEYWINQFGGAPLYALRLHTAGERFAFVFGPPGSFASVAEQ